MKSVFEELLHRTSDSPIQTMFSRTVPELISKVIGTRPYGGGTTYNIIRGDLEQFSCGGYQTRNFRPAE